MIIGLTIETDAIDMTKPANKEYLKSLSSNSTSIEFPLFIKLRECNIGEQFTDSGK
jgi:hypothetical protein